MHDTRHDGVAHRLNTINRKIIALLLTRIDFIRAKLSPSNSIALILLVCLLHVQANLLNAYSMLVVSHFGFRTERFKLSNIISANQIYENELIGPAITTHKLPVPFGKANFTNAISDRRSLHFKLIGGGGLTISIETIMIFTIYAN